MLDIRFYTLSLEENDYYTLEDVCVDITAREFKTDDDYFIITVEKKKGVVILEKTKKIKK